MNQVKGRVLTRPYIKEDSEPDRDRIRDASDRSLHFLKFAFDNPLIFVIAIRTFSWTSARLSILLSLVHLLAQSIGCLLQLLG